VARSEVPDAPAANERVMGSAAARDGIEVEWQFDTRDVRQVENWLAAWPAGTSPAAGVAHVEELTDIYLDTTDWRIHAAGYVLRLRCRPAQAPEATLKAIIPPGAGARVRREITEPLGGLPCRGDALREENEIPSPSRLLVAPGPVGQWLRALIGTRPLMALFTWQTRRCVIPLHADGEPLGEISLDEGEVWASGGDGAADGRSSPNGGASGGTVGAAHLQRVEVEVAPGADPAALMTFVETLREACGLCPAGQTKFELGLCVAGLTPLGLPDLGHTGVTAEQTIGEAAFAVLRGHFRAFLQKEPGTRLGEGPEALHQMRVATRRLRAALTLFADALPGSAGSFREELGWAAAALGEVRDLDVQLEQVRAWQPTVDPADAAALDALIRLLEERRAASRERLLKLLDSPRFEQFVAGFTAMLQRGPTRRAGARRPVLAVAPELIARRHRKVRRLGRRIGRESPPEEYHDLRIQAKRLRYALEFLADLYGRPARALIQRVVALQDLLGLHQDACVAATHLRELALASRRKLPPATTFVMGQIAARYRQEAGTHRKALPKVFRRLQGRPWRALRAAMERMRPHVEPSAVSDQPSAEPGPICRAELTADR
jgi:triphosphatase